MKKLAGTLACDAQGRPLVLHHGTFSQFSRFKETNDIGFHFGTLRQALERQDGKTRESRNRDGEWRVMKVALAVSKVVVFPDDPCIWTNWSAVHGLAHHVDPDFLPGIKAVGVKDSVEAARLLRDRMVDLGYDAIVYRNMHEADAGSVVDWSWLVFDPDAVVVLPEDFEGKTLSEAVGCAPGLELPHNVRDISAARNRDGSIRFVSERRSFIGAMRKVATDLGGEVGPQVHPGFRDHENTYRFKVAFLDGEASCEMQAGIGRLNVDLPQEYSHVMAEVVDDFIGYVGLSRQSQSRLIYEWQEGEPIEDFTVRFSREIERLRALAEDLGSEARLTAVG